MKNFFTLVILLLVSISACASQVDNSNQGVADASPGDHIIRTNGQKVVLKQSDINYAQRQLGITTVSTTQNGQLQSSNFFSIEALILLLVILVLIIIISVCIFTITVAVSKNSGMIEKDAKKVGISAGILACIAAAFTAAVFLGNALGINLIRIFL